MTVATLPGPVAAYFTATNAFDIEALMATFAPDALVNDHRDEFVGHEAIRDWAQCEIIGDRVTMEVTEATQRGNAVAVNAVVRGNFDKTGLPDPLVLTSYFSVSGDRIVQLVIVFNKSAMGASD
jgi:ketosteroid isomerase-like protein